MLCFVVHQESSENDEEFLQNSISFIKIPTKVKTRSDPKNDPGSKSVPRPLLEQGAGVLDRHFAAIQDPEGSPKIKHFCKNQHKMQKNEIQEGI